MSEIIIVKEDAPLEEMYPMGWHPALAGTESRKAPAQGSGRESGSPGQTPQARKEAPKPEDEEEEGDSMTVIHLAADRKRFLKEERPETYRRLKESGQLEEHALEAGRRGQDMYFSLFDQMRAADKSLTWELQNTDFMAYARKLTSIHHTAWEIVYSEVIYS